MLIFLDIDGVLHPTETTDKAAAFCHRPVFEAFLREQPDVDVVFSTSWRLLKDLNALRAHFSEDVRHRFIGVTPYLEDEVSEEARSKEILAWMYRYRQTNPGRGFVALDDDASHFPPDCFWLLLCDPQQGLDSQILNALRQRSK